MNWPAWLHSSLRNRKCFAPNLCGVVQRCTMHISVNISPLAIICKEIFAFIKFSIITHGLNFPLDRVQSADYQLALALSFSFPKFVLIMIFTSLEFLIVYVPFFHGSQQKMYMYAENVHVCSCFLSTRFVVCVMCSCMPWAVPYPIEMQPGITCR